MRSISTAILVSTVLCSNYLATAKPLQVYILAGQSNMEGHAHVRTFEHIGMDPQTAPMLQAMLGPDGEPRVCENVWISYLTDAGLKQGQLSAGFGAQRRGPKIGPEYLFGITLEDALQAPILLIKAAWGGKSLYADFRPPSRATAEDPTGAYYTQMINHVREVLADISSVYPGYDPAEGYEMSGFVWFQGWNDMVNRKVYPNRGKPGGYDLYTDLLVHFIRDVRKDLEAPDMRFVIGVMGIGGKLDLENPTRYTPIHHNFRQAMAKPASMPESGGNVVAVFTERYWDDQLSELERRWNQVKKKRKELKQDQSMTPAQREAALAAYEAEIFTAQEKKILEVGKSNAGFHYLGSAKILGRIGRAFAEAMLATRSLP